MNIPLWALIISIGINILMFIPAFIYKTDKLTDISYAITFIVVSVLIYIFSPMQITQTIGLIAVILWAIRLGSFLFIRINKIKKDVRFDGMREKFFAFLGFWLLQGISVYIILIPIVLLLSQANTTINIVSIIGIITFAVGLLIETIADYQKNQFKKLNTGKWIDIGIWRASRHPNYLGEIMLWIGIYLFTLPSLNPLQQLIALIGPIYIASLIIFVSGIPMLEKSSNKKWGSDKDYLKYKSKVPVLIPNLNSIFRIKYIK